MKRPFMVWIGFISICCSKVALGCWYYKELLKTLKVAQKLPSTIYLCLVLGDAEVNDEELETIFSGVESLLNSRPLTAVSDDPNDDRVLMYSKSLSDRADR